MKGILGQSEETLPFNASAVYPANGSDPDLNFLQNPFSAEEIERAVFQLAKNKSSGPDGLPSEFIQTYWEDLKKQINDILTDFYEGTIDLLPYNEANLVMIPKTEAPVDTSQFRPISVINLLPKLIAKILANRLRAVLPNLISPNQTAFVQGRQISENFVTTREMLQHIAHTKNSAVFVKIDFRNAFDTVEWPFLITVMQARGFPSRWINWIQMLWTTSTSRVCINGDFSESFIHKRGLRQGDPLSPMLFNIAVDVLQRMVQCLNSIVGRPLTHKLQESVITHQYADDTVIIAKADMTTLISLKLILRLFSSFSGLQINFNKSIFIPINVPDNEIDWIKAVIGCKQSDFPTTYLGMPLTIRKPAKELFIPIIERIEKRLTGWQTRMISRAGRLQLVQSVMSSIPIYHMMCFRLPKWVICRIDKARRRCLWGSNRQQGNSISLCNWSMAIIPKSNGGLGLPDLNLRNIALLLRWWWKPYAEPNSMWPMCISRIRTNIVQQPGLLIWSKKGSFFWTQLQGIKGIFDCSTTWIIGNGNTISYWFDDWGYGVLASQGNQIQHRKVSLGAAANFGSLTVHQIVLTQAEDALQWRWVSQGTYSANSVYKAMISAGKISWRLVNTWKIKIPPTVRLFLFLLLKGKVLTKDVMRKRNFNCDLHCEMCRFNQSETTIHLFFQCSFARSVWFRLGRTTNCSGLTIQEAWERVAISDPILTACALWEIWKSRNRKIFENKMAPLDATVQWIVEEATLWKNFC